MSAASLSLLDVAKPANGFYTPEDLLTMPDGDHFELIDGRLKESTMGQESCWVATALSSFLFPYCQASNLGWVLGADAGYQCFPGRPNLVRKPDVSFVRLGRSPNEEIPLGHAKIAPDLAVEVISPNDFTEETMEMLQNYLSAGVRLNWVIYPRCRLGQIFPLDGSIGLLTADQELNGEGVVPGFTCKVRDILPPQPATV